MKTYCGKIVSAKGTTYEVFLAGEKFEGTESYLVWVSSPALNELLGGKGFRNTGNCRAINDVEAMRGAQAMVDSPGFE